jgi:transposase
MNKGAVIDADDQVDLLRYLLVVALWRGGLSQAAIRSRMGLSMNVVNAMLKGVNRGVELTKLISKDAT